MIFSNNEYHIEHISLCKGRNTMNKKSPVVTIVAIGIGAALFFVLGRFVAIPSPVPNTNISIQYGLLAFMATLFGPLAGLLIAYGWGIWWSWVIASGVAGLIMGLGTKKVDIEKNGFGKGDIIVFNLSQVVAHIVAWGVVAPVLDILIYSEPANKVFVQGLVGGIANIVTTAIVGTLLAVAFAAAKPKAGSLKKEN